MGAVAIWNRLPFYNNPYYIIPHFIKKYKSESLIFSPNFLPVPRKISKKMTKSKIFFFKSQNIFLQITFFVAKDVGI